MIRGECLACTKLSSCNETNLQRVLTGYTCPLFEPVQEGVFVARIDMITRYGETVAVEVMLQKPPDMGDEII